MGNANGAGIPADPTFTSAWMLQLWRSVRRTGPRSFRRRILGARCLTPDRPVLRLALSGFRHRRSRRHPAFAPALLRPFRRPKPSLVRCLARSPGRSRVPLPIRSAAGWGLSPFRCAPVRPGSRPVRCHRVSFPLQRGCLRLAEASCKPSLDGPVDRCHRHPWDQNLPNFKALRLSVPVISCPEDKLKVRLYRRSDNILRADFSTLHRLACGHGWITQRFVDFGGPKPGGGGRVAVKLSRKAVRERCVRRATRVSPPGARNQASRLRRESSLRRRPLSLMKPSASFWS